MPERLLGFRRIFRLQDSLGPRSDFRARLTVAQSLRTGLTKALLGTLDIRQFRLPSEHSSVPEQTSLYVLDSGISSSAGRRGRVCRNVVTFATSRRVSDVHRTEPFVVELDRFQGPLDLLLHLIRSQDINIFDIPIATITRQFQKAIEGGLEVMPLERAGEFLEMAATLVRMKAQLLLPRTDHPDWEEDPRAELVRRLLEYEYFQDVVHVLEGAEAQRARHFSKGFVVPRPVPEPLRPPFELTLEAFLAIARAIPEPAPPPTVRPPSQTVTVAEKMSLVRDLLRSVRRLAFDRLVAPWGTRAHVVASFLAVLELARQQVVSVEQTSRFGSIWLFPGKEEGSVDETAGGEA